MRQRTVKSYRTPSLSVYCDLLTWGMPFSFVRYGDGEWQFILGVNTHIDAGSQPFVKGLDQALARTLTEAHSRRYWPAMQSLSFLAGKGLLDRVVSWLAENAPGLHWQDSEVFHHASEDGRLNPLVRQLHRHRTVIVGPPWLETLPFADHFVPVNPHGCWDQVDQIEEQVLAFRGAVVGFSAGPAAKVLIHRLHDRMENSFLIDFGSVWDPYCGVRSRSYHRRVTRKIQRQNLEGP